MLKCDKYWKLATIRLRCWAYGGLSLAMVWLMALGLVIGAGRVLAQATEAPVDIGSRLELLVDNHLIASMEGVHLQPHMPQLLPLSARPLPKGHYMTVIKDGERFRAWYRSTIAGYKGETSDGNLGEITCYAESMDGVDWDEPDLGLVEINGSRANNVVLYEPPFNHNFSPFLDTRVGKQRGMKFKALAGCRDRPKRIGSGGLHAFGSEDGLRWLRLCDKPVITARDSAFDSQNVAFWSEAEGCYVCYFRTLTPPPERLRTISRTTSKDFLKWSAPVTTESNCPGEHLYTSQTHPYFRAPHIYLAFPTRYTAGLVGGKKTHGMLGSTDILFMTARAGATTFDRLFTEAYIRPGLDPVRWESRANYAALNVIPTGPSEISLYHGVSQHRYVLRTDGVVSARAGMNGGTLTTKPLIFAAQGPSALLLNASTSAAGSIRCEIRDISGTPFAGFALTECQPLYGDGIELPVTWEGGDNVKILGGQTVVLHFELIDADLFAYRFGLID